MERMNFTTLLSKYDSIVIPKIQRDYAQGRLDKKASSVRNNLLNDIFSGKVIDFDFIFGTMDSNRSVSINGLFGFDSVTFRKSKKDFIPLDGQQRLTTLFLLYLYETKSKHLNRHQLSKFTYDTRHAAKDFCKAVVDSDWNTERKPSESITNSNWFMDYWQYDPTVEGMLTMLDAIHEKAKSGDYPDLDKISFYFFDMDEHGLNESLYLKMNSRGKPLTAFENLKADVDSILPLNLPTAPFVCLKDNRNAGSSFSDKWKFYIDRDWTDFFWNYKDENNLIDSAFVRFIANTLACYWAVNKKQDDGKEETIEQVSNSAVFSHLINLKGNDDFIDFSIFKSALTLGNSDAFVFLARTLSIFAKFRQSIDANSNSVWKGCDEPSLIETICKGAVTYAVRAVFFAVASYPGQDFDRETFKHWMRVVWNIVENANLNGVSELRLIHNLSSEISQKDIYEVLTTENSIKEKSFAKEQVAEEVAKAKKILGDGKIWEEKIIEAEKYAFFKGAIRFLFKDGNDNVDWGNFETKWKNAKSLIPIETEKRHTVKLMIPFIADKVLKDVFFKFYLSNEDDNLKSLLLGSVKELHNFFMQQNKTETANLSSLQSDLIYLCEQHPDYWIHNKWVNVFDVLSKYTYKSGGYIIDSYVVVNKFFLDRLSILEGIDGIKISYNQENDGKLWKGLFIDFEYKGQKFRWWLYDWVDMYDGEMNNLWEKGLHSHYMGDEKESFKDAESLKKELDRCVRQFDNLTEASNKE